jgi:DNA-binding transcriptional LysR family regulator
MVDLVFRQHGVGYKIALEAGGWEVIKKYVELGLGISIVTDVCLTGGDRLACIALDRYFPKRGYGIVLRRGKFLSPQAKRFVDVLNASFAGRELDPHRPVMGEGQWEDAYLG